MCYFGTVVQAEVKRIEENITNNSEMHGRSKGMTTCSSNFKRSPEHVRILCAANEEFLKWQ